MLTEAEKRAAKLAVSRYGVADEQVERVSQAVCQAQARGERGNFLESLVREKLLTASQAEELRLSLDATHVDLNSPVGARRAARAAAGPTSPAPAAEVSPSSLPPGVRAIGGYRLLRILGEGGMGKVYLAYHPQGGRHVAVKVLAEALASSKAYVERFEREARSGALLNHVNIVRNLAVGHDPASGLRYLVMEYVDGPNGSDLLERYQRLAVADAVHIALDVARALEHAHSRNVIHRDIKPDNILITRSGVAKLADLGLARRTDEVSNLTATRQSFGTPYYMPYEQAMSARAADARSDIYALGATLYHLITGKVPFPGNNHVEIVEKKQAGRFTPARLLNPDVPPVLDAVLERMLAREPAARYQTASELIVDLERSGLAAPVPSFADPDLALQDPVVRQRLIAPTEVTQLDVRVPPGVEADGDKPCPDVWFLRYRSRGQWCKAKAGTEQVIKRLLEGRIPAAVQASRQSRGPYRPLEAYPDFRPALAVLPPARRARRPRAGSRPARAKARPAEPPRTRRSWWLVLGGGLALSGLAAGATILYRLFLS
jgi:serine/threonine-protein kinase